MERFTESAEMWIGLVCSFFWQFPVIFGHFTNKRCSSKFISALVYCGSQFWGLPFLYTFLYAGKILVKYKNLLLLATRHPPQGEDMSGERDEGGAENKRWQWEVVLNDKLLFPLAVWIQTADEASQTWCFLLLKNPKNPSSWPEWH